MSDEEICIVVVEKFCCVGFEDIEDCMFLVFSGGMCKCVVFV